MAQKTPTPADVRAMTIPVYIKADRAVPLVLASTMDMNAVMSMGSAMVKEGPIRIKSGIFGTSCLFGGASISTCSV